MSTKKISFNLKLNTNNDELKKKSILCKSKTLGANVKLKNIIPKNINIQNCFKTMKLERSNRGILDIEKCKSLFRTFNSFYSYISLNNDEDETDHLLTEVAWSIFHKKCKKNTLIKKSGEKNEFFYLLMTGKIQKVSIVFKKEKVTLEEYLIYLLKMCLIKENELLQKCRQINKSIMNINYNNIEYFCEKNPKYNYSDLLKRATDEIINLGFDLKRINHNDEYIEIPSIQNYCDVGEIKKNIKSSVNKGPTIYLYIPKYELSSVISKGDFFGFLNKEVLSEYSSYICLEDCDLGYINKNRIVESPIFEQIDKNVSEHFSKNKNKYYIFKEINDKLFQDKYSIFMNYKKYKKGDKIFLQGSLNEGIYIIKDGEIKINAYSKINDLTKLMLKLIWSLKGFQEHVPSSEFKNIIKDNDEDNNSKNDNSNVYEDNEKYVDFGNLKEGDILGLNELYDYNTLIYNFSAECVSKEANLFFINKNNFNLMLSKEKSLYASVIQKVELRIKLMIGTIKNFKKHCVVNKGFKPKSKKEKTKIINDYINDKKPIIVKDLKQNFLNNSILWNKNESINTNEGFQSNISSIKKKHRNKSTTYFNTINCNLPNIREKIIESQDKVIHNKIFNKNKRYNNLNLNNNLYPTNILKFSSIQKPHCYENCMKEIKLMKNNTYNSLINKKSFKSNYQLYNYTTPNKCLLKNNNNNICIFNNTMENRKDILPFLGKDLTKGSLINNKQYFKTLYFPS